NMSIYCLDGSYQENKGLSSKLKLNKPQFFNNLQDYELVLTIVSETSYKRHFYRSVCSFAAETYQRIRFGVTLLLNRHPPGRSKTAAMPRQSLTDFLRDYPKHGRSTAFVQRIGYRTSRSSYREIAGLAAQCAREFERIG